MTTFAGALGVEWSGLSPGPMAWLVTAGCGVLGCVPLLAHGVRSRRRERLPVGRLPANSVTKLTAATDHARRLHELASSSPDGPVADDLQLLADTADGYVVALHGLLSDHPDPTVGTEPGTAPRRPAHAGGPLAEEADRVVDRLAQVVMAAEDLRRAQRIYLEQSSLEELTDRIRRLAAAIESPHGDGPKLP